MKLKLCLVAGLVLVVAVLVYSKTYSNKVLAAQSGILRHLPATTFSYGNNCDAYNGGCPLTAMTAKDNTTQVKTANDFFLMEVNNGYNGRVEFEYWNNGSGGNSLNVKYCDKTKSSACKTDNAYNTQRHRVSAKTVYDGMGNYYRTNLTFTGSGVNEGLAAVKDYYNETTTDVRYESGGTCSAPCSWVGVSSDCTAYGYMWGEQCQGPDSDDCNWTKHNMVMNF
jgi:hypothetical protein